MQNKLQLLLLELYNEIKKDTKKLGLVVIIAIIGLSSLVSSVFLNSKNTISNSQASTNTANYNRLQWFGNDWYAHGVNLPWYNYGCDFGCGKSGGITDPVVFQKIDQVFSTLQKDSIKNIRWWMMPAKDDTGPIQISKDPDGTPLFVIDQVYEDLDTALELAQKYDLYFTFVLFSSLSHIPSAWINDPIQRQKLADVIGNFMKKYENNVHILAWDLFNEPEWQIIENNLNPGNVKALATALTDKIHVNSSAYVTIGNAFVDGTTMNWNIDLSFWNTVPIDFLSPHMYDNNINYEANTLRTKYGFNKPIIVGEYSGSKEINHQERLQQFYDKGFAGAWAWSVFSDRTDDTLEIDFTGAKSFTQNKYDLGPTLNI